jgi:hypothetical protein
MDRYGAVVDDLQRHAGGKRPRIAAVRSDQLDRVNDVGAGLAQHVENDRLLAIVPAADAGVLQSVDDLSHVAKHHRRAVAPGDDDVVVLTRVQNLVVGVQHV